MRVAELWRFPVKSMRGERIDVAEVTDAGVSGDRAYALVDVETRKIASAKLPRQWGALLQCEAVTTDAGVVITLPDGTSIAAADPAVDECLSAHLGRPVELAAEAPARSRYLAVWPEIDGVMPDADRAAIGIGTEADGTLTDLQLAMASPTGTFFDVAALHVVTTSTLRHLGIPAARFRPTVVIDTDDDTPPFVENGWGQGASMTLGGVTASGLFPTMRCIMTTLAQGDLPRDNGVLQRVSRENRVDLPGFGVWSCVGAYLSVSSPGRLAVGDDVTVDA